MLTIATILHPTDFSEQSQSAFVLACALARDYTARLIALHVASSTGPAFGEGVIAPSSEKSLAAGKEQLDRLRAPHDNVRVERSLSQGDAAMEILRIAQEVNADLIVMGTHGRTGLERLLLGSVAEQVMRQAPCPVLTVKNPVPVPARLEEMVPEPALA